MSKFVMSDYDREVGKCLSRCVELNAPRELRLQLAALALEDPRQFGPHPGNLAEMQSILERFEHIKLVMARYFNWDREMIEKHGELYYRLMGYTVH